MTVSLMNALILADGEPQELATFCAAFVCLIKGVQEQQDNEAFDAEMKRIREQYGDDFANGMQNNK